MEIESKSFLNLNIIIYSIIILIIKKKNINIKLEQNYLNKSKKRKPSQLYILIYLTNIE